MRDVLELEPRTEGANESLFVLLSQLGRYDEAIEVIALADRMGVGSEESLFFQANHFYCEGLYQETVVLLDRILQMREERAKAVGKLREPLLDYRCIMFTR